MEQINWLFVFLATLSGFLIGGIWYSPLLFAKPWMRINGFKEENLRQTNKVKIFGLSFIFSLIMAVNLAMFIGKDADFTTGLFYGAAAGVWVFSGIAIVALFEQRPFAYTLINGGYCLLALALMGGIIGAQY